MTNRDPKIWTFSVPHVEGWFLVDDFSLILEKRVGDRVVWTESFENKESLLKYIQTNFQQIMPAAAI